MKTKIILNLAAIALLTLLQGCFNKPAFALADGSNGTVWMDGNFINQDLYKLSVNAKDIGNSVIGVAFDLRFEGENLLFLKYEPGDYLEKGGDPIYLVKSDQADSKIVFGESLTRDDKFPTGSGEIANFYFQVKGGVSYDAIKNNLTFSFNRGVVSTFKEIRQDLDQIEWSGLSPNKPTEISSKESGESIVDLPLADNTSASLFTQNSNEGGYLFQVFIGSLICLIIISAYKILQNRQR